MPGLWQKRNTAIRAGLIYGAIACLLWSAVPPVGRHLSYIDPISLTCARFLIAGAALGAFTILTRFSQMADAISNDLPRIFLLGLTGIFGMGLLLFASLRFTISVNSGMLINANPIFVVLLAVGIVVCVYAY